MTQRGWMLLVAASAGLLPGCANPFARGRDCGPCARGPVLARERSGPFSTAQPAGVEVTGPGVSPEQGAPVATKQDGTGPNDPTRPHGSLLADGPEGTKPIPIRQTSFPNLSPPDAEPEAPAARDPQDPPGLPVRVERPAEPKKEPLVEALRCILENRPNDALQILEAYDRTTQDFFMRLLPAIAVVEKKKGLNQLRTEEVAVLHEQVHGLLWVLRPRTEFVIGKMCFCERVTGYGQYQPVPKDHVFLASSDGRPGELVQVYLELKNFCNEYRAPYHETRFAISAEIFDQKGKSWWRDPDKGERKQPVHSHEPLHDYCSRYTFHVPPLPPGTYLLTVRVADETQPDRRREAHKSLEFRVTNLPVRGN